MRRQATPWRATSGSVVKMPTMGHGGRDEHRAHGGQEDDVVARRHPHRLLGAIGLAGAQRLAHHRRGRVGQPPRRQQREDDQADADGVAGHHRAAERRQDADQDHPAGRADEDLEHAGRRQPPDAAHHRRVEPEVARLDAQPPVAPRQPVELVEHAGAAAEVGGDGGAGHAERRERPQPEDEARGEHDVERVGQPQHAHGDRRVAGAAEDGVDEEEQHDRGVAAEHDPRVGAAGLDDRRRGAHGAAAAPARRTRRRRRPPATRRRRARWPARRPARRRRGPSRRCAAPPWPSAPMPSPIASA